MKQTIDKAVTLFNDEDSDNYLEVSSVNGRFCRLLVVKGGNGQALLSAENPEWVTDILIHIIQGKAHQDEEECPISNTDQNLLLGLLKKANKRKWFRRD